MSEVKEKAVVTGAQLNSEEHMTQGESRGKMGMSLIGRLRIILTAEIRYLKSFRQGIDK